MRMVVFGGGNNHLMILDFGLQIRLIRGRDDFLFLSHNFASSLFDEVHRSSMQNYASNHEISASHFIFSLPFRSLFLLQPKEQQNQQLHPPSILLGPSFRQARPMRILLCKSVAQCK